MRKYMYVYIMLSQMYVVEPTYIHLVKREDRKNESVSLSYILILSFEASVHKAGGLLSYTGLTGTRAADSLVQ